LLEAGALTDLRDMHGNTPLWTAGFSARGDYGVFQLLLRHGASLDNRNNVGKTVRDLAHTLFPDRLDGLVANA
jgi:ankyrin repeat protein